MLKSPRVDTAAQDARELHDPGEKCTQVSREFSRGEDYGDP